MKLISSCLMLFCVSLLADPVVVELYTSEGCSSCPSADALLKDLEKTAGAPIVPLGFHITYWNKLGWNDPYAIEEANKRQLEYAKLFKNKSIYTPQMIVDGTVEFVGNHEGRALDAIKNAAKAKKLESKLVIKTKAKDFVTLEFQVPSPSGEALEAWLAITEANLGGKITTGENAGKTGAHTAVVRKISKLGVPPAGKAYVGETRLNFSSVWKREDLTAVAFIQEAKTRRILTVATARGF